MFFQGINNFEELKKEYRRLAKLHHPDRDGGSDAEFKQLNAEYERKTAELLRGEGEAEKKDGFKETSETMTKYKDIIGVSPTFPTKYELRKTKQASTPYK